MQPDAFAKLFEIIDQGPLGEPGSMHRRVRGLTASPLVMPGLGGSEWQDTEQDAPTSADPSAIKNAIRSFSIDVNSNEAVYLIADKMNVDPNDEEALEQIDAVLRELRGDIAL